jgi:hypothetical protein
MCFLWWVGAILLAPPVLLRFCFLATWDITLLHNYNILSIGSNWDITLLHNYCIAAYAGLLSDGSIHFWIFYACSFWTASFCACDSWWAESEVGLKHVLKSLQAYHKNYPKQPWLKPAALLEAAADSGKSLQEFLLTRRSWWPKRPRHFLRVR